MSAAAQLEKPAPDLLRILSGAPAAAIIVALAVLQQSLAHMDADNSWLITVAQQVSEGAVAYDDIQESNPPLAFLVYMPAVHAARILGFRPEAWVVVEILLLTFASMGLSGRILRRGGYALVTTPNACSAESLLRLLRGTHPGHFPPYRTRSDYRHHREYAPHELLRLVEGAGFAVEWMRKDLAIVLAEANRNGARLPVTALIDQFYAQVIARGGRRWDTSSLIHLLAQD